MVLRAGRCGYLESDAPLFTHRLTLEDDAVAVVNESIEDGVSDGPIAEVGVPLIHRQWLVTTVERRS
jgi:hypothetical protein